MRIFVTVQPRTLHLLQSRTLKKSVQARQFSQESCRFRNYLLFYKEKGAGQNEEKKTGRWKTWRIYFSVAEVSGSPCGNDRWERPYVVALNFGFDRLEDSLILYLHSASEGRKMDILKKNPNVYFRWIATLSL